MANITISDLHPTGSALFSDAESFMSDLVDSELNLISGGCFSLFACCNNRKEKAQELLD